MRWSTSEMLRESMIFSGKSMHVHTKTLLLDRIYRSVAFSIALTVRLLLLRRCFPAKPSQAITTFIVHMYVDRISAPELVSFWR